MRAALQAAEAGATVLLVASDAEKLDAVAQEVRASGGEALTVYPTDLSSFDQVDALAEAVLTEHGGVDILIHNAARSIRRPVSHSVNRFHDFERTMALNYFAPVRLSLRLLSSLRERHGSIAHVLTQGVLIPTPLFPAYTATKASIDAFGDSLAAELQHEGLHVCSVYLPLVKTDMIGPTAEYAGLKDVMTPYRAAVLILDGVVDRKRRVMPPITKYFAFGNRLMPLQPRRASSTSFSGPSRRAMRRNRVSNGKGADHERPRRKPDLGRPGIDPDQVLGLTRIGRDR